MFFVIIIPHQKKIVLSCVIFSYEKLKNYSIKFFNESLFFLFCLFWFLSLSNNTLHVMFYTYICYWNIFQYNYIIQITFHVLKKSHARVILKDVYFLLCYFFPFYYMKLSPCSLFSWPCVQLHLKVPKHIYVLNW